MSPVQRDWGSGERRPTHIETPMITARRPQSAGTGLQDDLESVTNPQPCRTRRCDRRQDLVPVEAGGRKEGRKAAAKAFTQFGSPAFAVHSRAHLIRRYLAVHGPTVCFAASAMPSRYSGLKLAPVQRSRYPAPTCRTAFCAWWECEENSRRIVQRYTLRIDMWTRVHCGFCVHAHGRGIMCKHLRHPNVCCHDV